MVLVTGGTGFIGSHTAVVLMQAGKEVVLLDDLSNSSASVVAAIGQIVGKVPQFEQVNVCDKEALTQVFAKYKIDAVIHFAAFKAVGESVQQPLSYYNNNIGGLINLLEVMAVHNCTDLVFSSSCTVYGDPDRSPVTESTPRKDALSPYGNTKRICEDILLDQTRTGALGVISLRYFNPVGAHPSALIGELPLGTPNNLVPYITQTAIGKRQSLTVFGNDYPTPDGTCIRDYIHVMDLAQAHVVALDRIEQCKMASPYEVFNIGTGKGASVLDAIKAFEQVSGVQLNHSFGPRRAGDISAIWADPTRANEVLGWSSHLGLSDALRDAWNWEQRLSGEPK